VHKISPSREHFRKDRQRQPLCERTAEPALDSDARANAILSDSVALWLDGVSVRWCASALGFPLAFAPAVGFPLAFAPALLAGALPASALGFPLAFASAVFPFALALLAFAPTVALAS